MVLPVLLHRNHQIHLLQQFQAVTVTGSAKITKATQYKDLTLTKKESGYENSVYTIKITEMPPSEIIPEITITDDEIIADITAKTYKDAYLFVAVYDGGALKYTTIKDCAKGETKTNDPCPCGSGKKYKKCCGK